MKRIAIYGAGAMGTVLGAYLAKAGVQVDLVSRNQEHVSALNANGAHITGTVDFVQPVTACLPQQMTGVYDVVFLMTKQQNNREICRFLLPFLGENSVVITTQNGLPEPSVAEVVGESRTLGCAVSWGATFIGQGQAKLTSLPEKMTFALGTLYDNSDRLLPVATLLNKVAPCKVSDNFWGDRWAKLTINCGFSPISALTGLTYGQIASNKQWRNVSYALLQECFAVARSAGIKVAKLQGHDIKALLCCKTAFKGFFVKRLLPVAVHSHKDILSGMWYDIQKGRKCDIDYMSGVVIRMGRQYGCPTPVTEDIVKRIHEREQQLSCQ